MKIESDRQNSVRSENRNGSAVGKFMGFFLFRNLLANYENDKNADDDSRVKIKKYGVVSIILGVVGLVISLSCLITNVMALDRIGFSGVLMVIIYVVGGVIVALLLALYGLVFGILQVRLNRKSAGVVGIITSVLSIVSSIALVLFLIF